MAWKEAGMTSGRYTMVMRTCGMPRKWSLSLLNDSTTTGSIPRPMLGKWQWLRQTWACSHGAQTPGDVREKTSNDALWCMRGEMKGAVRHIRRARDGFGSPRKWHLDWELKEGKNQAGQGWSLTVGGEYGSRVSELHCGRLGGSSWYPVQRVEGGSVKTAIWMRD